MKKEKKTNVSSDVVSGMSSAVGATAGMIIGEALTTKASAATIKPDEPVISNTDFDSSAEENLEVDVISTEDPVISNTPLKEDESLLEEDESMEILSDDQEPEINILETGIVEFEDGTIADVALMEVDGQAACVLDVDMDGEADVLAVDFNNNANIEEDEVATITGEGIYMADLQAPVATDDVYLASNAEADYINDADVTDYLA